MEIVRLSSHIGLENQLGIKVKTIELIEEADQVPIEETLSPLIAEALGDMPLIQADVSIAGNNVNYDSGDLPGGVSVGDLKKVNADSNALLVVGHKLLTPARVENLSLLKTSLKEGGFILSRENAAETKSVIEYANSKGLDVILEKTSGTDLFVLLRKREKPARKTLVINVSNEDFEWVEEMKKTMKEELEKETAGSLRIVFVSEGDFENGMFLLKNCFKKI